MGKTKHPEPAAARSCAPGEDANRQNNSKANQNNRSRRRDKLATWLPSVFLTHPIYYLRVLVLVSTVPVATQIRGHIAGVTPPSLLRYVSRIYCLAK